MSFIWEKGRRRWSRRRLKINNKFIRSIFCVHIIFQLLYTRRQRIQCKYLKNKYKHNFEAIMHTHTCQDKQLYLHHINRWSFFAHKNILNRQLYCITRDTHSEIQAKQEDKVPQQCFSLSFDKLKKICLPILVFGCMMCLYIHIHVYTRIT